MSKKKDEDSWSYGGVKRRDFRHAHDEPEIPAHSGKRKDTKKWCKGKEGKEHVAIRKARYFYDPRLKVRRISHSTVICENCGKKLRRFSGEIKTVYDEDS